MSETETKPEIVDISARGPITLREKLAKTAQSLHMSRNTFSLLCLERGYDAVVESLKPTEPVKAAA